MATAVVLTLLMLRIAVAVIIHVAVTITAIIIAITITTHPSAAHPSAPTKTATKTTTPPCVQLLGNEIQRACPVRRLRSGRESIDVVVPHGAALVDYHVCVGGAQVLFVCCCICIICFRVCLHFDDGWRKDGKKES